MTSSVKSASGLKLKTYAYENFQGLDTSRDVTSLDTGKDQHLTIVDNATCDWRGQIVRDPAHKFLEGQHPVNHIAFFNKQEIVYVEEDGAALNFKSERNHVLTGVYDKEEVVTSTTR